MHTLSELKTTMFCFLWFTLFYWLAGGNKHPLPRKPFKEVDQVKLEAELEQYCKHVGVHVAFDLKAYANMTTPEAVDIHAMMKLQPLLWALLNATAPCLHYVYLV